ncbi:MAG: ATP synthase F0 subunit B [Oligoflexia bacterium]|nr:ATP synthase F0 subunit B [Oligoflexia bacterium]
MAPDHTNELPKIVLYQAINLSILVGILYYFLKGKVGAFFVNRHKSIKDAVNESKRLKEEAEKRQLEFEKKLQNLERDTQKTMELIRKEGELTKQKIILEAKRMAEQIEIEAKKSVTHEIDKAKKQLFSYALESSLEGAKTILDKQVKEDDQQRLTKEFLDNVGTLK